MREIKFRGVATKKSQFSGYFTGLCGPIYDPGGNPSLHDGMSWIEVEPQSLGQYTGLKDKNGKEIYEGDIVSFGGKPVLISWNGAEAIFWGGSQSQRFVTQYFDLCQVIGNIFVNPELLESVNEQAD